MENQSEQKTINLEGLKEIQETLSSMLNVHGFESHPLKIGWYNEQVSRFFQLPYSPDTLAFVIISTPSMFEKAFVPFMLSINCLRNNQDPLDQCMIKHLSAVKQKFQDLQVETIHDFELSPTRRPKILVQTAGHVSGAVRYYQRKDVTSDPWDPVKKIFGVCLHPSYGGWFALRAVAIFTGLTCPDLVQQPPKNILKTEDEIIDLLQRYNDHWEDWSFRDIIPVKERYSEEQQLYFSTKPAERKKIIESYLNRISN